MRRRFLDLKPKDVRRERFRTSAYADTCCVLYRFASFSKLPCWFHVCVFDLMDRLGGSLPDVVLWPGYTGSLADVVLWPGLKDVVVDGSETRLSRQDQIVLSLFQVDWHSRHSLFRIPYHFSSLLLFAMVFLSLFLSEIWLKECMEDFQTVTDLFLRCFVMVVILSWRNELRVQGLNHCIQPFVLRFFWRNQPFWKPGDIMFCNQAVSSDLEMENRDIPTVHTRA